MPKEPRTLPRGWWIDAKGVAHPPRPNPPPAPPAAVTVDSRRKLGRKIRQPNKTESEAALIVRAENPGCSVQYEPLTFLCDSCKYTPDLMITDAAGSFPPIFYEVKGPFRREKDILRLKAAAAQYRFRFILMEKLADEWKQTVIRGLFDR